MPISQPLDLKLISCTIDYSLNNPDTLTKYKTAAQISHRVLEAVTGTFLAARCGEV